MSKRIFQLVASVVLIFAALTPLAECFDHWDRNVAPANDTELRVTAWFVCAGFVLTAAKVLKYAPKPDGAMRRAGSLLEVGPATAAPRIERIEPTASPPLVPLRI